MSELTIDQLNQIVNMIVDEYGSLLFGSEIVALAAEVLR